MQPVTKETRQIPELYGEVEDLTVEFEIEESLDMKQLRALCEYGKVHDVDQIAGMHPDNH